MRQGGPEDDVSRRVRGGSCGGSGRGGSRQGVAPLYPGAPRRLRGSELGKRGERSGCARGTGGTGGSRGAGREPLGRSLSRCGSGGGAGAGPKRRAERLGPWGRSLAGRGEGSQRRDCGGRGGRPGRRGGPAGIAVPGPGGLAEPRRAPKARRGLRERRGRGSSAEPGPCPPALTLGFSSDMAARGCGWWGGGRELGNPGAGESRSQPAALPPQLLAGPRFAPQILARQLADARSRGECACTTRAPGAWSARPVGPRFPAIGNASRGGAPRHPRAPTPGGAQALRGGGRARRNLRGPRGIQGGVAPDVELGRGLGRGVAYKEGGLEARAGAESGARTGSLSWGQSARVLPGKGAFTQVPNVRS